MSSVACIKVVAPSLTLASVCNLLISSKDIPLLLTIPSNVFLSKTLAKSFISLSASNFFIRLFKCSFAAGRSVLALGSLPTFNWAILFLTLSE